MAASDSEKADFLDDPQNYDFFQRLVSLMWEQGWLQLIFLTVDERAVATYFNLDYDRRLMVYNSGLLRGEYDHLSAGILLLAHNIRYAIENHYEVFDFLRGDETYKYHMGGRDTSVFKLEAQFDLD
jgi:CelD/BcsL family acetyltransferase involved in cellulose biosynthesis